MPRQENCEIVVCHVDTPGNDWNQLFQTINSLPGSYLADASQGNVFGYGQAKSFYEQVAPTGSVALIYSGKSMPPPPPPPRPLPDPRCTDLMAMHSLFAVAAFLLM